MGLTSNPIRILTQPMANRLKFLGIAYFIGKIKFELLFHVPKRLSENRNVGVIPCLGHTNGFLGTTMFYNEARFWFQMFFFLCSALLGEDSQFD